MPQKREELKGGKRGSLAEIAEERGGILTREDFSSSL
jgi:hypothetical protein